ncbi:FIST N-terminal domain-containing protein [Celeribacter litoreus]|uniref:FIST N-terminal domain-containing protein n=1 Tax=Celeribacter litoreus TaxID=2876714 RepID=UPI001CCB1A6F|nr:FIST N-terminal domain-containing protein [Celeribacter litoreus]MCA0044429.1 FIST C-terminal domain-containing protein [Celeribacter litoreus]
MTNAIGGMSHMLRQNLVSTAEVDASDPEAVKKIVTGLGRGPFSIVLMFFSPECDRETLARQLKAEIPYARVMGCSTAGELSSKGYDEGKIIAIGFPVENFGVETLLVPDLKNCSPQDLMGSLLRARQNLQRRYPQFDNEFAMLLVDGLSEREDELTAALASGLGPVPLFGGSAGDGRRFQETFVLNGPTLMENSAILTFFRTNCQIKVFSYDHLVATQKRMVVTEAEPNARVVKEINAEPAAQEYARLVGVDPALLSDHVFAANPVVVQVGGKHHVRAIKSVAPNGDMSFFAAIDEGLVLTLAEPQNMVAHLEESLAGLSKTTEPAIVLACDCIFRRVEAEMTQVKSQISNLLAGANVRGFSTYGEQIGSIHVNQTFTGVAIYPPCAERDTIGVGENRK